MADTCASRATRCTSGEQRSALTRISSASARPSDTSATKTVVATRLQQCRLQLEFQECVTMKEDTAARQNGRFIVYSQTPTAPANNDQSRRGIAMQRHSM